MPKRERHQQQFMTVQIKREQGVSRRSKKQNATAWDLRSSQRKIMAFYGWDDDWKEEPSYNSQSVGYGTMFDLTSTEFAPPAFMESSESPFNSGGNFESMDMDYSYNGRERRRSQDTYLTPTQSFAVPQNSPMMDSNTPIIFPSFVVQRGNQKPSSNRELTALGKRDIKVEPTATLPRPRTAHPPRTLVNSNNMLANAPMTGRVAPGQVVIVVHTQPPVEVRTRTPSEKRSFSASVTLLGPWKSLGAKSVIAELAYSPQSQAPGDTSKPRQGILTGSKRVQIKPDGRVDFTNLSMSEASTKHNEREFCLRFTLLGNGTKLEHVTCLSSPFYAYSNSKVLTRRRNIQLEVLSRNFGSFQGGEKMHVVGNPFIKGPSLQLVFRSDRGDVSVSNLRRYSDTVLFFTAPAYPGTMQGMSNQPDVRVEVLVTNDGRNFSQPLHYTYTSKFSHMRSFL